MTIPIDEAIGPDCLIQSPGSTNDYLESKGKTPIQWCESGES